MSYTLAFQQDTIDGTTFSFSKEDSSPEETGIFEFSAPFFTVMIRQNHALDFQFKMQDGSPLQITGISLRPPAGDNQPNDPGATTFTPPTYSIDNERSSRNVSVFKADRAMTVHVGANDNQESHPFVLDLNISFTASEADTVIDPVLIIGTGEFPKHMGS